jgi:hypothetical protein
MTMDHESRQPRARLPRVVRYATTAFHGGPLLCGALGGVAFLMASLYGLWAGITPASTALFCLMPSPVRLAVVDTLLPLALLSWAAAGCALSWVLRRSPAGRYWRRSEWTLARRLRRYGLPLAIVAAWFGLAAIWSQANRMMSSEDYSESAAIFGHVPWSDANAYYSGASGLAFEATLDTWNQRRPLNAALFSVRLAAGGFRLDAAVLIQVVVLATCVYLLAVAVGARYGPWAGLAAFAMLWAYSRLYMATALSESLGISLGALGAALLIRSLDVAATSDPIDRGWRAALVPLAAGSFAVGLAMSARAGALFLLPALVIWAVWHFGAGWRRRAAFAACCMAGIAVALGVNGSLLRLYGTGKNSLGSNFASTLCGMAEGTDWDEVSNKKYREQLAALPTERERAAFLYARAAEGIRAQPSVFLGMAGKGESKFLVDLPKLFAKLTSLHSFPSTPLGRKSFRLSVAVYCGLCVGAAFMLWRRRREGDWRLWLALVAATLASAPFVFLDGGWRVFAASWPLMIGLFAGGFTTEQRLVRAPASRWLSWPDGLTLALLFGTTLAALAGPWVVSRLSSHPSAEADDLARASQKVLVRTWPRSPVVAVLGPGDRPPAGMPSVSLAAFQSLAARRPDLILGAIEPPPATPFAIGAAYDFVNHHSVHLYGPLEVFTVDTPFALLRTSPAPRGGYYYEVLGIEAAP